MFLFLFGAPAAVHTVCTCATAATALEQLREKSHNFDLVLSDVYMPGALRSTAAQLLALPGQYKLSCSHPQTCCIQVTDTQIHAAGMERISSVCWLL